MIHVTTNELVAEDYLDRHQRGDRKNVGWHSSTSSGQLYISKHFIRAYRGSIGTLPETESRSLEDLYLEINIHSLIIIIFNSGRLEGGAGRPRRLGEVDTEAGRGGLDLRAAVDAVAIDGAEADEGRV